MQPTPTLLTAREREIAALVAKGLTSAEVGARLGISKRTVEGALLRICRRVGVRSRGQLTAWFGGQEADAHVADPSDRLPEPLSSFVGREQDVDNIVRLLASARLLTLVGPGGVGKTRLALQAARSVQRRFTGGAHLVELSRVDEDDLVDEAVARTLRVRRDADRSARDVAVDHLRERQTLLVLDNCEHLIDASAAAVEHLLGGCPGLTVLATSREPILVPGERMYRVSPLGLPEAGQPLPADALRRHSALRLFVERARLGGEAIPIADRDLDVVAQICRSVDGLPLAVELAAAHIRTLSPAALLARLPDEGRFRVLVNGYRTAEQRHRSLETTVAWSYRLLSRREQALFARLAVFAGAFDLRSAQQVGGAPPVVTADVLELVSCLVDKSLIGVTVGRDGEVRYQMLETLRAFGRERLRQKGEAEATRRRHAEHYAEVLAKPALTWTRAALDDMRHMLDDVRAALIWSLANEPLLTTLICGRLVGAWGRQGPLSEGRQWIDRIIDRLPDDDVHKVIALSNGAWLAQRQGAFEVAERYALEELRIARRIGNHLADAHVRLGDIARNRGLSDEAIRYARDGVDMRRREDDPEELALALVVLGSAEGRRGELETATRHLGEAITLFEGIDERGGVALGQAWLGELAVRQRDVPRARALLADSLRTYRSMPDAWMVANVLDLLGWLAGIENEPVRALRLVSAAEHLRESIGGSRIPALAAPVEDVVGRARRWLRTRASTAWEEGHTSGPEQAISYALRETDWQVLDARTGGRGQAGLTPRELEVAQLMAEGLTDKEIAARLGIGARTVEHHAEQVRKRLGCASRAQVAAWVVRHDLALARA